jgi:hypothetical protein
MNTNLLKQLSEIIAPMAKGKTEMETAAGNVKERCKSDLKEYKETERRYNKARSNYNGWLAQLEFNIKHGLEIKFLEEKYKPIAEEIETFVNYVDSQVFDLKKIGVAAILAGVPAIVDIANKLWNLYRNAKKEEKEEIVKEMDAQNWREFKAI